MVEEVTATLLPHPAKVGAEGTAIPVREQMASQSSQMELAIRVATRGMWTGVEMVEIEGTPGNYCVCS